MFTQNAGLSVTATSGCISNRTSLHQPHPQASMRYRETEGGLEPNAIARGEFSRRARRVTSQLILRRGRLGTRSPQL